MAYINRRQFLGRTSALGFASSFGALAGGSALKARAADTTGYKALVCVFLNGGMDQSDTIIPYDQASWNTLRTVRNGLMGAYNADQTSSSRNRANLLQLVPDNSAVLGGHQFALPPELSPLHALFGTGELAVVGNVGPLIEPVTRQQIENKTGRIPPRLGSHNDGRSLWTSLGVEGSKLGWGGQFADAAIASAPADNPTFAAISTGPNGPFLAGATALPFRATSSVGLEPIVVSSSVWFKDGQQDRASKDRMRQYLERSDYGDANYFNRDFAASKARAFANSTSMLQARQSATPIAATFPGHRFGQQMQLVAETIQIQQALNTSRQVFYVTISGYDTHSSQSANMPALHTNMAEAFSAFRNAMVEIGQWNNTTLFTASDFGRVMVDNGDGTDHGWGGHHLVMGGSVQGRRIYGNLPGPDIGGPDYSSRNGRLTPSVSVEQYAATLGRWFGLNPAELASVLPNLSNFSQADLGFLG